LRWTLGSVEHAPDVQFLRQQKGMPLKMATRDELYESMALMQSAIRDYLAPIAEEYNKPLDPGLVSAVMFEREKGENGHPHWVVHLYTLSPGLVIGKGAKVADGLRARLCDVGDDPALRLNLIDFAKIHAARKQLSAT